MDNDDTGDMTLWIRQSRDGDEDASEKLYEFAYERLKRIARKSLGGWRSDGTLDTTSLVHEFFIKHTRAQQIDVEDRRHFFNLAARMMRQIMINSAKKKTAQKRGGSAHDSEYRDGMLVDVRSPESLLVVDEVLDELENTMPDHAEIFMYRTFAHMTVAEIAAVMDKSPSTVKRHFNFAKTFVMRRMLVDD